MVIRYNWLQFSICIYQFSFRMSSDNGVGYYSDFEDAQYYTISLKQRYAPLASPDVAYIVQLHNCIYSETSVRYLQRVKDHQDIDTEKPIILIAHQFCGNALAEFNATVRQLKVVAYRTTISLHILINHKIALREFTSFIRHIF